MQEWRKGTTMHLKEGVYITAPAPSRSLYAQDINGGGGPGRGGAGLSSVAWGPYDGPDRGRSRGPTKPSMAQEATLVELMGGEQSASMNALDGEHSAARAEIPAKVESAVTTATAAGNIASLPLQEGIRREFEVLSALVVERQNGYLEGLPRAHAFFGSNPLYQLSPQFFFKLSDKGGLASREALDAGFQEWETSYRTAQELNLTSEQHRLLVSRLPAIAQRQYQADEANKGDETLWISALEQRIATIRLEHRFNFEILPAFLQAELIGHTQSTPDSPLVAALSADHVALAQLASKYAAGVRPPGVKNPNLTPPLAKLELAALKNLVDWQAAKLVGERWADYHSSTFNSECSRYLSECAVAISGLQARAQRDVALLEQANAVKAARHAAEQQAQEAARAAAEQHAKEAAGVPVGQVLPRNTYSYGVAGGLPAFALAGGRQLFFPVASSTLLQASIRAGVAALAAGAAGSVALLGSPLVLTGLVVGVVALTLSSRLGNGEMQFAFSTPLADLIPVEDLDLQAIGAIGGGVGVPYTLATDIDGDQARVMVVKPDGIVIGFEAKVFLATSGTETRSYSVMVDSPARSFTFTPIAAPGTEQPAPTVSPTDPVDLPKYDGVELQPIVVGGEGTPTLDVTDISPIVIGFPADSGLPPLLIVFSKTPVRLGETGFYNDLVRRSAKDQMDLDHIPAGAAIGEALRTRLEPLTEDEIQAIVRASLVIAVPSEVHRKYSETYGGRNTKAKIELDSKDLNVAIDNNFDSILPGLLEYGMTTEQTEQARQELKVLAKERGLLE